MARNEINKLVITKEAELDYFSLTNLKLPKYDIKLEMEEYIDNFIAGKADGYYKYYFRAKYFIDEADKMFMFFIYKDNKFGTMQLWKLAGICLEEDWSEELEECGQIRFWLNSKIVDLPDEIDWVIKLRLWQEKELEYIKSYSITGIGKEARYGLEKGGYDPYSQEYDYLSHDDGKWNGKPRHKRKNEVSRKEYKRIK